MIPIWKRSMNGPLPAKRSGRRKQESPWKRGVRPCRPNSRITGTRLPPPRGRKSLSVSKQPKDSSRKRGVGIPPRRADHQPSERVLESASTDGRPSRPVRPRQHQPGQSPEERAQAHEKDVQKAVRKGAQARSQARRATGNAQRHTMKKPATIKK